MQFPIFTVHADQMPAIELDKHALVVAHEYICAFDIKRRQPYFVAYKIHRGDFETDNVVARNFTVPKQGRGHVIPEKLYGHNEYDVGHLVALASKKMSRWAYEVNWMFCVAIQRSELNRGPFLKCENFIRKLAEDGSQVSVIVACLFDGGYPPMQMAIDAGMDHEVPSQFIVLIETPSRRYAFVFPQDAERKAELRDFSTEFTKAKQLISETWWETTNT